MREIVEAAGLIEVEEHWPGIDYRWREPEIKNLKLLDEPFHSDDLSMPTCHENAIKKDGGIVVYSDPIDEVLTTN